MQTKQNDKSSQTSWYPFELNKSDYYANLALCAICTWRWNGQSTQKDVKNSDRG